MVQSTAEVLKERGTRYGNYLEQCQISRVLRDVITQSIRMRNTRLYADQEDALMMMCVKISRIINGDPDYADNWDDIAGYAKLVANRLSSDKQKQLEQRSEEDAKPTESSSKRCLEEEVPNP